MMMMKFFFFGSLAHLYLAVTSSVMPQHENIEPKRYDDFELMRYFRRYLNNPNGETYSSFKSYALSYCDQSPLDSLKPLIRYQNNWVFKIVYLRILIDLGNFIDPTTITREHYYYNAFKKYITEAIANSLLECCDADESKYKTELGIASLLVEVAEVTSSELKFHGINDKCEIEFDNRIAVWKYLIKNISIDFARKTIDYDSLFHILREIRFIVKTNNYFKDFSRLAKPCTLFWLYIHHIYKTNCKAIFDLDHCHKSLVISLVMSIGRWSHLFGLCGVFKFEPVSYYLVKICKTDSMQSNHIAEIFREYDPRHYCELLNVSTKILSFRRLTEFLDSDYFKQNPRESWIIRALAELELHLSRRAKKLPK